MKPTGNLLTGIFITGSLAASLAFLHAQTTRVQSGAVSQDVNSLSDTEVLLQAIESVPPAPAASAPRAATFFSAQHAPGTRLAWPPLPANARQVPVWNLGDGVYLLADLNVDYSLPVSVRLAGGGMAAMDDSGGPVPGYGGGGSTNDYEYSFTRPVYSTNDLWLEITGLTNTITGKTAYLTIHKPWNDTNLFHDLYFTTSLDAPRQWNFVMRCPYINAVVPDLRCPVGFFELGAATNGNLTVTTNATPQQLAQLLVPPWVTVANATYTGAVVARGAFTNGNGCGLPINSGVILSTGCITNAIGPNNDDGSIAAGNPIDGINSAGPSDLWQPGDADLNGLVGGGPTYDAAVLEFDMVSTNSVTLQFQYTFASEEYPEWINSYNDPMAIFVSTNRVGTTWVNSITNDLALVPGTANVPVGVNTINGGCVDLAYGGSATPINAQYYIDNHDPDHSAATNAAPAAIFNIQYDGMTVLLTAQAYIAAGITNHVKIAIADYADTVYDSAIFLKAWKPSPCQCEQP